MGTVHAKSPETERIRKEKIDLEGVQLRQYKKRLHYIRNKIREIKTQLLFHRLKRIKAKVDKVHVDGLNRTKDDIVVRAVTSMFKAKDFQEVVLAAHEVRTLLETLGCFKNIGIFIDTSHGPDASPNGLEVTFYVDELKRLIGGVNTLVGNNEGSLVFGLRMPNLFGRGEKFQTEYSYGTKNATGFTSTFSKPLLSWKNANITAAVFQQANDFPWSGYKSNERGILFDFLFESTPKVSHNFRWEGVWREMNALPDSAFGIREEAGHSLKSAIKYTLTVDRRDSPILPNRGCLFRLQQEYAGLGGDIGFFKNELELQGNYPLPFDLVGQVSLMGGIATLLNKYKYFNVCDRFFLGGPLNLRGFANRGVGPISDGCSLGATAYWASGAHIYTFLPFRPGQNGLGDLFRLHFFVNAGNINDFEFTTHDYHENIAILLSGSRISYGAGLVLRIGQVARFELNYCVPLKAQKNDKINPGLQFGIGVSYL